MIKKILLVFLNFLILIPTVKAADFTTSLEGTSTINAGDSFNLTLKVSGNNIWGITAGLSYDNSKLTLESYTADNGFTATVGSNIVLDSTSGHNGTFTVLNLKFKASSSFVAGQSTVINIVNPRGSTDSVMLTGVETAKKITVNIPKSSNNYLSNLTVNGNPVNGFNKETKTYSLGNTDDTTINIGATKEDEKATVSGTGSKTLNYGRNEFEVVVRAENGNTAVYKSIITRNDNRSKNNYLSSLSVSAGNINFNKNTTVYSLVVDNNVSKIKFTGKAEDSKSTVNGLGDKNLLVYSNTFRIVVVAENGSERVYTINVIRKDENGKLGNISSDSYLKSIEIEDYQIEFDKDKLDYAITVESNVTSVSIKAMASSDKATVQINNVSSLEIGNNVVTIKVVAEDGSSKEYKINIFRKEDILSVELDSLLEIIESKDNINKMEIKVSNTQSVITKDIISVIGNKNIELIVNNYQGERLLYAWYFNSKELKSIEKFDTLVKLDALNKEKIAKITNYSEAIYLNFSHSGKLPNNTLFKVYVGDKYNDGDKLNLYFYDDNLNKLDLKKENIIVQDGYVSFEMDHCSEYILTRASYNNSSRVNILAIIEGIIILAMIGYYLIIEKKIFIKK